jgi:hypothetical protein
MMRDIYENSISVWVWRANNFVLNKANGHGDCAVRHLLTYCCNLLSYRQVTLEDFVTLNNMLIDLSTQSQSRTIARNFPYPSKRVSGRWPWLIEVEIRVYRHQ